MARLFERDNRWRRLGGQLQSAAVFEYERQLNLDPHWRDYILFYEYFHGATGRGWELAIRRDGPG
jgi:hypothetical protein